MNCPHCNKVIVVKLLKDSNVGQAAVPVGDLAGLLAAVNVDSLDAKSMEFYAQTKDRFEKYGANTRMSEKQMKWLRELAAPESENAW